MSIYSHESLAMSHVDLAVLRLDHIAEQDPTAEKIISHACPLRNPTKLIGDRSLILYLYKNGLKPQREGK